MSRIFLENQKAKRRLSLFPGSQGELVKGTMEEFVESRKGANFDDQSLYVHIPFCERMCSFCACNTSITGDHSWEEKYLKYLTKEIEGLFRQLDIEALDPCRIVVGGGTPNFFSSKNFKRLLHLLGVEKGAQFQDTLIELDWRYLDQAYIDFLKEFGFRQFRLALLDIDSEVSEGIQRNSSQSISEILGEIDNNDFEFMNFEFLLGLPFQKLKSFDANFNCIEKYKPQFVTLNHFVQVPWIKESQRLYRDSDIPEPKFVAELERLWIKGLSEAGYHSLGFGYWCRSKKFISQGIQKIDISGPSFARDSGLIGLGVGSLSQFSEGFWSNQKNIPVYSRELERNNAVQDSVYLFSDRQIEQQNFLIQNLRNAKLEDFDFETLGVPNEFLTAESWKHFLALGLLSLLETK